MEQGVKDRTPWIVAPYFVSKGVCRSFLSSRSGSRVKVNLSANEWVSKVEKRGQYLFSSSLLLYTSVNDPLKAWNKYLVLISQWSLDCFILFGASCMFLIWLLLLIYVWSHIFSFHDGQFFSIMVNSSSSCCQILWKIRNYHSSLTFAESTLGRVSLFSKNLGVEQKWSHLSPSAFKAEHKVGLM